MLKNKEKFKKHAGIALIVCTLTALSLFPIYKAYAAFVTPQIVFIEKNQRATQISINNRGDKAKIFKFSWQDRIMTPFGGTKIVKPGDDTTGYKPAQEYLQFSPRQVILKPKEHQTIRVMVRRSKDMPEGEYHSHLFIEEDFVSEAKKEITVEDNKMGGTFEMRIQKSIPFFLRHGETKIDFTISSAAVQKNEEGDNVLHINVSNNSTRSIYAKTVLKCQRKNDTLLTYHLTTLRLYTEAKAIQRKIPLRDFPVSECKKIDLEIFGTRDFEFKGASIMTVPVSF